MKNVYPYLRINDTKLNLKINTKFFKVFLNRLKFFSSFYLVLWCYEEWANFIFNIMFALIISIIKNIFKIIGKQNKNQNVLRNNQLIIVNKKINL